MIELENKIIDFLKIEMANNSDASHDISHLKRVAQNCKKIQKQEGGNIDILIISSYFHDIISLPKNSPDRHRSSELAAQKTISVLREYFREIPTYYYEPVADAIRSHSYSANIQAETLEAKILQDADRLDALGAVGLARVFYIAGKLNQKLFDNDDPFALNRPLDDSKYALDHFYNKLLKLPDTLHTHQGKLLARERILILYKYLENLKQELSD